MRLILKCKISKRSRNLGSSLYVEQSIDFNRYDVHPATVVCHLKDMISQIVGNVIWHFVRNVVKPITEEQIARPNSL